MTDKPIYRRLPDDDCISEEKMYRYIDGDLSSAEMYAVEMHVIDCALCADAIEGLSMVKERKRRGGFFRWLEGLGKVASDPTIVPLWRRPFTYYSAAACALLLIGFFTFRSFVSDGDMNAEPKMADLGPQEDSELAGDTRMADSTAAIEQDETSDLKKENNAGPASTSTSRSLAGKDAETSRDLGLTIEPQDRTTGGKNDGTLNGNQILDLPQTTLTAPDFNRGDGVLAQTQVYNSTHSLVVEDQSNYDDDFPKKSKAAAENAVVNTETVAPAAAGTASASSNLGGNAGDSQVTNTDMRTEVPVDKVSDELQEHENVTDSSRVYYPYVETDGDVTLSYQKGLELLTANDAAGSLIFFDDVIAHPTNANYQDAEWNKVTALIKLAKNEEAKVLLQKIISEGGKYKTQAETKLKTL